jgi:hypothetical protein
MGVINSPFAVLKSPFFVIPTRYSEFACTPSVLPLLSIMFECLVSLISLPVFFLSFRSSYTVSPHHSSFNSSSTLGVFKIESFTAAFPLVLDSHYFLEFRSSR